MAFEIVANLDDLEPGETLFVEGLIVTCPLHGSQYCQTDGSVRRGPSHQPQPVIRTRVRNGWIEVRGNQPAPRRRPANGRK